MKSKRLLRTIKKVETQTTHTYLHALLSLSIIGAIIFFSNPTVRTTLIPQKQEPRLFQEEKQVFNTQLFEQIHIEGKAYVIYDIVDHQVITSFNQDEELPLASITKVMTMLTALSSGSSSDIVTVDETFIEDGYDLGLKKKQQWSIGELLKYMLVFSSNDAAITIANHYGGAKTFVAHMNEVASSSLLQLSFTDPAGRDTEKEIGGKGSAYEAAKLFAVAFEKYPELLDATTKKRQTVTTMGGRLTGVPNTNQEIETISGAFASKTGFTDAAGGNLGIIVDLTVGRPVVIVVLGSTREGRFRDVDLLYKTLRKSLILPSKEGE